MKRIKLMLGFTALVVTAFALTTGTRAHSATSPGDKPASATAIKIDNFSFGPATITIPAGTTVTWTNNDDVPHVVTSDDNKMFKSKALDTDDHFSFMFAKPGTYNYQLLLRDSPEDDSKNRCPVTRGDLYESV